MMDGPQWLEERRKGIGGSDVAAIMGLSPYKTAYQVYREKRKEVEGWHGNNVTDWGKRMEPAIRQWYSDTTGRVVRLPEKILYHQKHRYMLASLDGFTDDNRGLEIKTSRNSRGWGEPGTNQIPDYYMLQVQHYMGVTGLPVFDVPVSIGGASPEIYEVPADLELIGLIIAVEGAFWARVENGNPPDPVTYADAVQRFGTSATEGVVIATTKELEIIYELAERRDTIKRLQDEEESLKAKLIITLGEAGNIIAAPDGKQLITYKLSKGRTVFDAKALEAEVPDIYRKYLKHSEPSRRFLLK